MGQFEAFLTWHGSDLSTQVGKYLLLSGKQVAEYRLYFVERIRASLSFLPAIARQTSGCIH